MNRNPLWTIKLAKKESIKLLSWLYYKSSLPSLRRKKDLAYRALTTMPFEKRLKYSRII